MSNRTIEDILKKQLAQYHLFREQLAESRDQTVRRPAPVITVSNMTGCCPRDLSRLLSERLDCQVWEPDVIGLVARDVRLRQEVAAILEAEVTSRLDGEIEAMIARHRCRDDEDTIALVRVIKILAETGGVVLQGRGGAFVLGDRADLRLRLVAGERHRIEHIMRRRGVDAREAGAAMRAGDSQSTTFVRRQFHADVSDSRRYDLVLNTERLEPEAAAELAERFLDVRRRD